MPHASFVHLHVHSTYSLLESTCRVDSLVEEAKRLGMPALALTDAGNLFAAVEFHNTAIASGIKPVLGAELFVTPGERTESRPLPGAEEAGLPLVLLIKNETGYRNLIKLSTIGYLEGLLRGRPRVDLEALSRHSEGLILLSGGAVGFVGSPLLRGEESEARRRLEALRDLFGPENLYVEILDHGLEDERLLNARLIPLARSLELPLAAANDVRYLKQEEAHAHDVLLCVGSGSKITERVRPRLGSDQFYLKTAREMTELFFDAPEAMAATLRIAERCNFTFETGRVRMPAFQLPAGFKGNEGGYLAEEALKGFEARYGGSPPVGGRARLDEELNVIIGKGYAGYLLIVADFIRHAKDRSIPVGPGRGSGAASLVCYCLGITDVDPIRYGLIFERFLNPERPSLPDIDVDFCQVRRDEVIAYVRERYGADRVAQIITFGTLKARNTLRDVGRVYDIPYAEVDRLARLLPDSRFDESLADAIAKNSDLQAEMKNPQTARLFETAQRLEGGVRNASTHAAGVVIAGEPLDTLVPLYQDETGHVTTQYDMNALEKLGLPKTDFLGLRNLTVIAEAECWVLRGGHPAVDWEHVPLDDPPTYALLQSGRTMGIFQLDSRGMRDLVKKMAPTRIEDLIAVQALYRPGALNSGATDAYIRRKHGREAVDYPHSSLEPILEETYGTIIYQEQVLKIANLLAGISLGKADELRRAMGKKVPEVMGRWRGVFLEGCKKNKVKPSAAEEIWRRMETFAQYGFNKAHATAYAMISFRTAYLKAHFPREYMAALLSSEMGFTEKLALYIEECREMGLVVHPPDVQFSGPEFIPTRDGLRFALPAVKNVGVSAASAIAEERARRGVFKSLFDFCCRVNPRAVNRKALESLIRVGAFDWTTAGRSAMIAVLDEMMAAGLAAHRDQDVGQVSLFGEKGGVSEPPLPNRDEFPESELLAGELELTGVYLSGHPLARHAETVKIFSDATAQELRQGRAEGTVRVGGILKSLRQRGDRRGETMATALLEDFTGTVEMIVFASVHKECGDRLIEGETVLVEGRVEQSEAGVRLIAAKIFSVEEGLASSVRPLHLRVSTVGLSQNVLEELGRILEKEEGMTPVYLHLETHDRGEVILNPAVHGVTPSSDLLGRLKRLLGEEAVEFESDQTREAG